MRLGVRLAVLGILSVVGIAAARGEALAADPSNGLARQVAGGGVTVTATLLKDQGDAAAIKLALETHSVDLDGYKWETIARLRDDRGKTYPLQAVENASGGGHHRQAILRFGKPGPEARTVELIVKDVAGVKERVFRWSATR
jgi:hypothetical protein